MRKDDELLRQAEVARVVGVSRSAVAQKIEDKLLESVTVGGLRFVPWRAVRQWQAERSERGRLLQQQM